MEPGHCTEASLLSVTHDCVVYRLQTLQTPSHCRVCLERGVQILPLRRFALVLSFFLDLSIRVPVGDCKTSLLKFANRLVPPKYVCSRCSTSSKEALKSSDLESRSRKLRLKGSSTVACRLHKAQGRQEPKLKSTVVWPLNFCITHLVHFAGCCWIVSTVLVLAALFHLRGTKCVFPTDFSEIQAQSQCTLLNVVAELGSSAGWPPTRCLKTLAKSRKNQPCD